MIPTLSSSWRQSLRCPGSGASVRMNRSITPLHAGADGAKTAATQPTRGSLSSRASRRRSVGSQSFDTQPSGCYATVSVTFFRRWAQGEARTPLAE
jgi:hypothetical protein